MPLYDYKCGKCGQVFEVRQSFADPLLTIHDSCGGPLERLISAPALQFKGSGWYITDYARGGSGGPSGGSSSSKGENKNEGKSDGKSEGKSEAKSDSGSSSSSSTNSKDSGSSSSGNK